MNEGLDPAPADLDRSTPFRAWSAFVKSCQDARPDLGAHLLNLGELAVADRRVLGTVLAKQLCAVLEATGKPTSKGLDDTPLGPILDEQPQNHVRVATVTTPTGTGELWLRRTLETSTQRLDWLLTRFSVSLIQRWYQELIKKDQSQRPPAESLNTGLGPLPGNLKVESPREAVARFLELRSAGNDLDAARLIDLSKFEPARQSQEGPRLARRLALVLKRLQPEGYPLLSNDSMGAPEHDVPIDEEVVVKPTVDGREIQVRLARFPRLGGEAAWIFSAETASQIDGLYARLGYGWAGDHLPAPFFEWQLWEIQLWQWAGILIALLLGGALGAVASLITRLLLLRLAAITSWTWDDELVAMTRGPLALLFWVLAFVIALSQLALADAPRSTLLGICKLVAILAAGWLLVRMIDVAADSLTRFFKGRRDDLATSMVPVFRKVLKPMAGVLVGVFALQNAGMNVAGLLAGLGIGGIAIALAAKPALENLFGSVAIAFDRPFKIGDFVKVGDFTGTIEDVGLRSTKIRTLDRTLVTIPNGQMADAKVENFSARDRIRLFAELAVEYATTPDQLRLILDEIKRHLIAHPRVRQEDFVVRFVGFGTSALRLELIAYILTNDFAVFTGVREGILMDVGDIVRRAGAKLALASQTVYVAREAVVEESEKAREAAELVARRRSAGELCVPEIPQTVRDSVQKRSA